MRAFLHVWEILIWATCLFSEAVPEAHFHLSLGVDSGKQTRGLHLLNHLIHVMVQGSYVYSTVMESTVNLASNTKGMISGNASGQQFSLCISPLNQQVLAHCALQRRQRSNTNCARVNHQQQKPTPCIRFYLPLLVFYWFFFFKLIFIQLIDIAFKHSVSSWTSVLQPHCVRSCSKWVKTQFTSDKIVLL